jgi:glutathione S-transferase
MAQLYTMPETCSLAPNIAVAWLDAPVEIKNMAYGDHKKEDYLRINPKGKVPALRFDDGDVLTEVAAILSYLGAAHGDGKYGRDTPLGRREAEALSYMTSEVHADYGPHYAAQRFADGEDAQEAVKAKTYEKLRDHYARLESELKENGNQWYLSEKSFADTFLYVLERWIDRTPLEIGSFPALKAHRERMQADEGVRLALERQGMEPV